MALKVPQSSFSKGEIDPVLQERTTLQSFKNGLRTARNWVVGKTGSIFTRPGRAHFKTAKLDDRDIVGYCPPGSGYFLEFGHEYVRVYTLAGTLVHDVVTIWTEAMLPSLHFDSNKTYVYIFCFGVTTRRFDFVAGTFMADADFVSNPAAPTAMSVTPAGAPAGYALDYAVTYVSNGQESLAYFVAAGSLPIAAGQSNLLDATLGATAAMVNVTEARLYRRPQSGGIFGYIGSTNSFSTSGGNRHAHFTDLGQGADYGKSIPQGVYKIPPAVIPVNFWSKTGLVYQQRLLMSDYEDLEAIYASRPGFPNDFTRNFPYDDASALKFKSGTSGYARVLRMLEADGLVIFTSAGIYLSTGTLGPSNIALAKKGKWIIKDSIPPLAIPGGVFFVDDSTNTIRNLAWSTELASYNGQELSIFSDHLFRNRGVTSWAFQEGVLPLLWVTFDDGTYASFTWEFDQEMKAWTRHDSATEVKQVVGTGFAEKTFFIVKNGTKRYIEITQPRFIPASLFAVDPEADKNPSCAFMDSMVSFARLQNNGLIEGFASPPGAVVQDKFVLTPVTPDDWEGPLTLSVYYGLSPIFDAASTGQVGNILRIFDEDKSAIDLEIIARASDYSVTVQPNQIFPEYLADDPRIYWTYTELTGLDHLEGEAVSIISDGAVVASPNNDIENYEDYIVNAGKITLPSPGAIIHVGRPVPAADLETLDIDTVEQAPTVVESKTVNKLYVKVHESRGLYIGHVFPPNNKVNHWEPDNAHFAMQALEEMVVDQTAEIPLIGNRYNQPQSTRYEVTLPGDWNSNGRICLRQVDPVHSQVLSIIPDVEVHGRSDR